MRDAATSTGTRHTCNCGSSLPKRNRSEYLTPLFDALNERLTEIGYCDEIAGHKGQFRYYVYGKDQDKLAQACRAVAAEFPLPHGAYIWKPGADRSDEGERIAL